jgi:hypothetical protein
MSLALKKLNYFELKTLHYLLHQSRLHVAPVKPQKPPNLYLANGYSTLHQEPIFLTLRLDTQQNLEHNQPCALLINQIEPNMQPHTTHHQT